MILGARDDLRDPGRIEAPHHVVQLGQHAVQSADRGL
jgi:hypothetical protein